MLTVAIRGPRQDSAARRGTSPVTAVGRDLMHVRGITMLVTCLLLLAASAAFGATYYLDAEAGDDAHSGRSPQQAWRSLEMVNATAFQPGDHLLLKAGARWTGRLWPQGSGAEHQPIVLDRYGEGRAPRIDGEGRVREALHLRDQHDWEIGHLEVTNHGAEGPAERTGVRILGERGGVLSHLYLRALHVHDVNGHMSEGRDSGKCNAGILFDVFRSEVGTCFDDVRIEDCIVAHCDRSGIKTWTDWSRHGGWAPYTKLVIRGNRLDDIGGDGIIACMAIAPLVEHNVASNCAARGVQHNTWNAAIWVWETDDAVIQFNEACLTRGTNDGQGFDIDGMCRRTLVQYNYSHDNEGGFILLCESGDPDPGYFNDGSIVRYNISQDDGARVFQVGGKVTNARIYNNLVYVGEKAGNPLLIWHNEDGMWPDGIEYANNVFYNLGRGGFDLGKSAHTTFTHNVFFGQHAAGEPEDPEKLTADPQLEAPGTGRRGLESVNGYRLRADSPCRDGGLPIPDNGGRDYWGNPVPSGRAPSRGAHQS